MFTSARHAGQQVSGRIKFQPKNRAKFVAHAVRAITTVQEAESPDGDASKISPRHAVEKTFDLRKSLEEIEMRDMSSERDMSEDAALFERVTREPTEDVVKLSEEAAEAQKSWNLLAEYLIKQKLKLLNPKEFPTEVPLEGDFELPIFEGSPKLTKVFVEKRFSSRKLPHLLTLVNDDDEKIKYIFKEDDDISMDVAIMELLKLANQVWSSRKCPAHLRTYNTVATSKKTGFCEVIPGDTMLNVTDDDITGQLGSHPEQWESFYYSLVGIMVVTAAFDITDRHDNNVLFTPDGDIALIDLSASLGKKAPMDKVLSMNPVYFPSRIRGIHRHYKNISGDKPLSEKLGWKFWDEVEEDAMVSYYSLYNNYDLRRVLKQCGYRMPTPLTFLRYIDVRRHNTAQRREGLRNGIVQQMEDSDGVTKVISKICKVLPAN